MSGVKKCEFQLPDGTRCGSMAFNLHRENIKNQVFCDACHWRFRYDRIVYRVQELLEKYT